jgi:ribosome-binding factor A
LENAVVTVPEVRMSPDLKLASAYVMPLGGANAEAVVEALNRHHRFIRGRIAPALDLKFAPDIRFFIDTTFEEADRIEKLLRSDKVRRDLDHD